MDIDIGFVWLKKLKGGKGRGREGKEERNKEIVFNLAGVIQAVQ